MKYSEWKKVRLMDIVDILGDGLHGTPKYDNDGEYYFINGNNLNGKIVVNNETKKVNYDEHLKYKKNLNERTILVSINGTLGNVALYNAEKVILGKSACYFNVSENVDKYFIKYIMISNQFKEYVQNYATGTTIKNMGLKLMREFSFCIPSLHEQRTISHILLNLDDKIELNNQINNNLQSVCQLLFKQWFVDFEFKNEEGLPYKSSGGEMVDSEIGLIPKGWEVRALYDYATFINGTSFKQNELFNEGLPIIKIVELKDGITNGTKYFKGEKDEKYTLENGDMLFSWSGNPDTSIDIFLWYRGKAILNQHIFKVVVENKQEYSFVYLLLKYFKPQFTEIARNKQTTGLGHVTINDLKRLKFVYNQEIIIRFNKLVNSLVLNQLLNYKENLDLSRIRDILLPKLMNGEIEIDNLELNL
jgi:type I restriction enzyme S subunit